VPIYRVQLEGRNFWLEDAGKTARMGFEVVVFVPAASPEAAAEAAMRALGEDEALGAVVRNGEEDPPRVYVTAAEPLAPELAPPPKRTGFKFFADDGERPGPDGES
jgi:hypothetical protein